MNDTLFEPVLDFGPDIAAPAPAIEDAAPAPAKGRGRPRKYATEEERLEAKRERDRARRAKAKGAEPPPPKGAKATGAKATEGTAWQEELDAMRAGYEAEPQAQAATATGAGEAAPDAAPGPVMSGYLLLVAIDGFAPAIIRFFLRRDTSALKLTDAEMKRLEPLADAAAKQLFANVSPAEMFAISIVGVYAAKIPALPKLERKKK